LPTQRAARLLLTRPSSLTAGQHEVLAGLAAACPEVTALAGREHPGQDIPGGHAFTQPWPAGPANARWDQVIYY
jgi:hypothetical protein